MTFSVVVALFVAMAVLALVPGPGIVIVVSRTLSQGFLAGVVTCAGIVAGDFVFIVLAVYGLSALSQVLGDFFLIVKYLGAAYLIWLGIKIILSKNSAEKDRVQGLSGYSTNFAAGLLTTLGNPKAIIFYVSFFPAFLDLSNIEFLDLSLILLVAAVSVGGVMILYAYLASKTGSLLKASRVSTPVKFGSGVMLMGSGVYVAARA